MPPVKPAKKATKPKKAAAPEKMTKPKKALSPAKRAQSKAQAKPVKKYGQRADLGAPIDGFFAKQPAHLRAILEALRELADEAAPEATKSIKWGMPFYSVGSAMMCALAGHKAHVNLVLAGPPEIFVDPAGLLEGGGKTGRHLKVTKLEDLPRAAARGWLRAAANHARRAGG
jgi:hypothetical protein